MSRWQYSKAFSRSLSFGGSSLLDEDVAETMDTTELSTSDRSSVQKKKKTLSFILPFLQFAPPAVCLCVCVPFHRVKQLSLQTENFLRKARLDTLVLCLLFIR